MTREDPPFDSHYTISAWGFIGIWSSTQAFGEEAVNLLFEKHRLNRIA